MRAGRCIGVLTLGLGAMVTLLWLTAVAHAGPAAADILYAALDCTGIPHCYPSIQAAVDAAHDGDTVRVVQGTYLEAVTIARSVTLATGEPHVRDRARREFEFYHTLAGQIPLRTPRMLADDQDPAYGTCLLLAALEPIKPPQAWTAADFESMAEELAELHARFWGQTAELNRYPWLRRPAAEIGPAEIEAALAAWQTLGEQERLKDTLTVRVCQSLGHWVAHISAVDAVLAACPLTLCHGDCHIGNLLRDAQGNRVWADWQEVGVGRGPEDLSFLLQRASHDGAEVPWEQAVTAYQRRLQAAVGEPVALAAIQRTVEASELRTELTQWPFYLQWATADQVSRMVHRIRWLVSRLELEPLA